MKEKKLFWNEDENSRSWVEYWEKEGPSLASIKSEQTKELIFQKECPQEDYDWKYWWQRALKRESVYGALISESGDIERIGPLLLAPGKREEDASPLFLTKKAQTKALLLDRDGVVNVDDGYIFESSKICWKEGLFDLIQYFKSQDYKIIILTNQSGIAKGYYKESDVAVLHQFMSDYLKSKGCEVDGWYYCPFHKEGTIEKYKKESWCRKPRPLMGLLAQSDFDLDLSQSLMIGDKLTDRLSGLDISTFFLKGNYDLTGVEELTFDSHESLLSHLKGSSLFSK